MSNNKQYTLSPAYRRHIEADDCSIIHAVEVVVMPGPRPEQKLDKRSAADSLLHVARRGLFSVARADHDPELEADSELVAQLSAHCGQRAGLDRQLMGLVRQRWKRAGLHGTGSGLDGMGG